MKDKEFYPSTSKKRMQIVKSNDFFLCMQDNGCDSLFPSEDWGAILKIYAELSNLDEQGIRRIQMSADQFEKVHNFLDEHGFYQIPFNSDGIQQGKDILGMSDFKDILDSMKSSSDLYAEYVNSPAVKAQADTGVCIDIALTEIDLFRQTLQEDQIEGHTKIHIGFEGRNCSAEILEATYDLLLSLIQDYGFNNVKVAAPYPGVNSMLGKEFTVYLRKQNISGKKLLRYSRTLNVYTTFYSQRRD